MFFYLTTLKLDKYLKEVKPVLAPGVNDVRAIASVDAWIHGDFLCKGYVQNRLIDPLYNVYSKMNSAKELWDSLEKKYKTEDAGPKKFAVAKFLDFKMVDSKPIMEQVEQLQVITHEIQSEGMNICDTFQVAAFIEKLPPSWKDFKNYLKHKRKAMSLEDLVVMLRIESSNRKADGTQSFEQKANLAEHQNMGKKRKFSTQSSNSNKKQPTKKFAGKCYKCGKMNHKVEECRSKVDIRSDKGKGKAQANLSEASMLADGISDLDLCAVISEVNLVGSNTREWWYDIGATRHICSDNGMFTTYQKSSSEEQLFMGNSSTSKIEGHGKVVLKLTSEKELTLNNVLHVPEIQKNLISGSVLSKHGFMVKLVSDNLILSKNGVYLGKGYVKDGLFKLNVMTVLPKTIVSNVSMNEKPFAYVVESSLIWHERLGHVNYKSISRLMNMNLIPKCKLNKDKCEVCVQAKLTKTPSPRVERSTEPLGLIHTDLCDLKYIQTRGGKKYFVTFIDDS
ncbi:hypothetical protein ACHQM5_019018 [Ranunculus cassubicifolius]